MGLKKGEVSCHVKLLEALALKNEQTTEQLITAVEGLDHTVRKALRDLLIRGKVHRTGHWLIGDRRHLIYALGPGEDQGTKRLKTIKITAKAKQTQYNKSLYSTIRAALAENPSTTRIFVSGKPVWSKDLGYIHEEIRKLKAVSDD